MVDEDFWATILFNRYFPPKGTPPKEKGKLQNFPQTEYYNDWFKLMFQLLVLKGPVLRTACGLETGPNWT